MAFSSTLVMASPLLAGGGSLARGGAAWDSSARRAVPRRADLPAAIMSSSPPGAERRTAPNSANGNSCSKLNRPARITVALHLDVDDFADHQRAEDLHERRPPASIFLPIGSVNSDHDVVGIELDRRRGTARAAGPAARCPTAGLRRSAPAPGPRSGTGRGSGSRSCRGFRPGRRPSAAAGSTAVAKNFRSRLGMRSVMLSQACRPAGCPGSAPRRRGRTPCRSAAGISAATRLKPDARLCPARSARASISRASGSCAAKAFRRLRPPQQQPQQRQRRPATRRPAAARRRDEPADASTHERADARPCTPEMQQKLRRGQRRVGLLEQQAQMLPKRVDESPRTMPGAVVQRLRPGRCSLSKPSLAGAAALDAGQQVEAVLDLAWSACRGAAGPRRPPGRRRRRTRRWQSAIQQRDHGHGDLVLQHDALAEGAGRQAHAGRLPAGT